MELGSHGWLWLELRLCRRETAATTRLLWLLHRRWLELRLLEWRRALWLRAATDNLKYG